MNLTQFQTLSKRTMPFGGEPANQVEFENMLGNYAMGLVGEAIELKYAVRKGANPELYTPEQIDQAFDDMLNEMGDILHYAVGLLSCLGEVADESRLVENKKGAIYLAGDISELVKKHIYHRHELNKEFLIRKAYQLIYAHYELLDDEEIHISEIMQMNIAKLKTRYPDKFSVEDSIARVDTK